MYMVFILCSHVPTYSLTVLPLKGSSRVFKELCFLGPGGKILGAQQVSLKPILYFFHSIGWKSSRQLNWGKKLEHKPERFESLPT